MHCSEWICYKVMDVSSAVWGQRRYYYPSQGQQMLNCDTNVSTDGLLIFAS